MKASHSAASIQECAGNIMQALHGGTDADLGKFSKATVINAYRLLLFEQLLRRNFKICKFELTGTGISHIEKHGYVVYITVDKAKKPR